jgi:hypothetical protein
MSEPKLTNAQIRQRRREAALKGARTRAAKQLLEKSLNRVADLAVNGPDGRQLITRAQAIGREADLWSFAHLHRYPWKPTAWTGEQRQAAEEFLSKFIRDDGTPQPVPHRKPRRR